MILFQSAKAPASPAGRAEPSPAASEHGVEQLIECSRRAAHFKRDVEAFGNLEPAHRLSEVGFRHVDRDNVGHLLPPKLEALRVDVGDHDMPGADMARDGASHAVLIGPAPVMRTSSPSRSKASAPGVDRVAERIEDRFAELVASTASSGKGTMVNAGTRTYSAKAPGMLDLLPRVSGSR